MFRITDRKWAHALAAATLLAVATGRASADEAAASEVEQLRQEVAALRGQLAMTQLELRQAMAELKQMQELAQTPDAAKQAAQWRTEREAMAAERKKLEAERRRLEQARIALRAAAGSTPPGNAAGPAPVAPAAADAPPPADQPRPDVDYQIGVIHIGTYAKTYVNPVDGLALVNAYPTIDRSNIMVRGTLLNRSSAPWRYTFEVRVGGRDGNVIGRWRHQTEPLGPNEMGEFEVKVPIATDVSDIRAYQIGNIRADRPEQAAEPGAASASEGEADAPASRDRTDRQK